MLLRRRRMKIANKRRKMRENWIWRSVVDLQREKLKKRGWVCFNTHQIARWKEVHACSDEGVVRRKSNRKFDTWIQVRNMYVKRKFDHWYLHIIVSTHSISLSIINSIKYYCIKMFILILDTKIRMSRRQAIIKSDWQK
jgi:hypothetical protein